MEKLKIALWGITDNIWNDIRKTLDWRKIEIVFFIDNNPYISGKVYEGKEICNFNQNVKVKIEEEIDYVLIAAYSGYRQILEQLKSNGISMDKVQLYISKGLREYCFGSIENVDISLIKRIYTEADKMIEIANQYNYDVNELDGAYFLGENEEKWYRKNSIIAHACGGYINGNKIMYSNSREALEDTLRSGVKVIECDILEDEKSEIVCLHDYYRCWEATEYNYTIQTLKDVIEKIVYYRDVYLLIDIKWENIGDYNHYLSCILKCIEETGEEKIQKQIKEQIILEVYEEESIRSALKGGFDVFFTQYKNPDMDNYKKIMKLCLKYDIGIVGYDFDYIKKHSKMLQIFREKNISVFGYSCDSITEYADMRQKGLAGIFSNYIREIR